LPNFGDGTRTQAPPFPSDILAVDTETTGFDCFLGCRVFCIIISDVQGRYLYVRLSEEHSYLLLDQLVLDKRVPDFPGEGQGDRWEAVSAADWRLEGDLPCKGGVWTLDKVRALLEGDRPKVFHNFKFDVRMLYWTFGWVVGGKVHDTLLLARLMVPSKRFLGLKILSDEILRLPPEEEGEVKDWFKRNKKHYIAEYGREPLYIDVPDSTMKKYAVGDVHRTLLLLRRWWISMHDQRIHIYEYELELAYVIMGMEDVGMRIDMEYTQDVFLETERRIHAIDKEVWEGLGEEFNVNSDVQLRNHLLTDPNGPNLRKYLTDDQFNEFRRVLITEKGHLSVARSALKIYKDYDTTGLCAKLMLRGMLVGMDKYYKNFMEDHHINSKGQAIVRPSILQHTAKTGRFSIIDPALQTIPSRSSGRLLDFEKDEIPDVRRCFVPTYPSWNMYAWDYSQIELRIIAFTAQEKAMIQAFVNGEDVHDMTTHTVWDGRENLEDPVVWKRCRTFCKMVNFGLAYGMEEEKFHQELNTPMDVVRSTIKIYGESFPGISNLMKEVIRKVNRDGYLHNVFGRLLLPSRQKAYAGVNYTIQSTAADIMKRALVHVDRYIKKSGIRAILIMTVHDEIIMQIHPEDDTLETRWGIKRAMEYFPEFAPLPITVGCKRIIDYWSKSEEVTFAPIQ